LEESQKYYLYLLIDPTCDSLRYVGFSKDPYNRFKQHVTSKQLCHKTYWINTLKNNGLTPLLKVIDEVENKEEALQLEKAYIKDMRLSGIDLTNTTIGGDAPMIDRKHSDETKAKMSQGRLGEKNSFYGKKHSKETIEKLSNSLKGKKSWNKGKQLNEEHRKALCKPKSVSSYKKGQTRFDLNLMTELLSNGEKQNAVAKYFNTDQGTISRYIKKHSLNIKQL
jgi:group I intron endonuclease